MEDEDRMPAVLAPVLDFVALCVEQPNAVAKRIALVLTICAMGIGLAAALLGTTAGLGVGLLYAASAWLVSFALRYHSEKETGER
jgi:hypothetical protein